jgi:lipopolysaccharide export LptBFGC system permease protein LptF
VIPGLLLPAEVQKVPEKNSKELLDFARDSSLEPLQKLNTEAVNKIRQLFQTIQSELHSRGSFSLSCLTLVMFGAALGILLRGKNPLAVFVLGFVPAVVLVLLITAGREMTEGDPKNVRAGIALIWAGNIVLLGLVAGVYGKLLRK